MLCLPDSGFQPSVNEHNVRLDVLADWIEGSVAFIDEELSQTDVVDALCENSVYRQQDFASERVADAWIEVERRGESVIEGAPFEVAGRRIRRRYAWNDNPAYSFCLLLAVQVLYKGWAKQFGSDFTEQGELFEKLTAECLQRLGWTVHRTGWAPGNSSKIKAVIEAVCAHVGEPARADEIGRWISESGNEEGLDVVCSDPFYDGWGG